MKLSFILLIAISAFGQIVPDRYIVELSTPPAARVSRAGRTAHRARIATEQRRLRGQVERGRNTILDQFDTVQNALVVHMSAAEAARVRQLPGVKRVNPVRIFRPRLDRSLPLQKFPDAWTQIGGAANAGKGIKIAIIDSGVDIAHPAFSDAGMQAPDGYPRVNDPQDTSSTNGKIIVARSYPNPDTGVRSPVLDIEGHGTAVAMIAAGASVDGPFGPVFGAAPGAWLGIYKVFLDDGGGTDDLIIRAIEDAVNDGMDVLNLSLGSIPAFRLAADSVVAAVENAAAAGKVIAIAAGNSGPDPDTLESPASAPSAIAVGNSSNDRAFSPTLRIPDRGPYVVVPGDGRNSAAPIQAEIVDVATLDGSGVLCAAVPEGSLSGKIVLILRGDCAFEDKLNYAMNAGAVAGVVYARAEAPDPFVMGVGSATLPAAMVSWTDGSDLIARLGQGSLTAALDFTLSAVPANSSRLAFDSSYGPGPEAGIKPDMVAVGSPLVIATPTALGTWGIAAGTSFSSPTVAGAAALLMSARPGLTAAQYRSLLVNASGTFPTDGTNPLAVQQAGAGVLNLSSALDGTVTANPISLSFGTSGGTVDTTRTLTIANLGTVADTFAITAQPLGDGPVPSIDRNTLQLDPGQSADVQVRFVAEGLAGAAYQGFFHVQGTQAGSAAHIAWWHGVPSQTPKVLQTFYPPASSTRNATETIFFRFVDPAGLAVTDGVNSDIVSGGAKVVGFDSFNDYVPGVYWADVRMPATAGTVTVHIELRGVSVDLPIVVR